MFSPKKRFWVFQSTLPVGGATCSRIEITDYAKCFNPRSPWGERREDGSKRLLRIPGFNPRSPWGERPYHPILGISNKLFQSTLPVGGATCPRAQFRSVYIVSIHAPRGGSDLTVNESHYHIFYEFQSTLPVGGATLVCCCQCTGGDVSIHAPRGGSDEITMLKKQAADLFQSTLPVGGATPWVIYRAQIWKVSIHAPRGGSDLL